MKSTSPAAGSFDDRAAAGELIGSVLDASTAHSIIATDLAGTILLWNEGARRLYGHRASEVVGRPRSLLHPPHDLAAGFPQQMLDGALAAGKWEGTVVQLRKDGGAFTARVVITPRRDDAGHAVGFLSIATDISAEVRLTAELEQIQLYTHSLIESAPDALVIVDAEGAVQLSNAETGRMFGYTHDELAGRPVEMLIAERYRDRHPGYRASFFAEPRARPMGAGHELWGRRKDGAEFPVEVSLSPLPTPGRPLAMAAIRDVGERNRVAEELRRTVAALEAASFAKDRFLASMSHELRTPLNSILGFSGTLLMELPGPINDEQRKQLTTVEANGRHLLSIINDLLDVAKIESGTVELRFEPVPCADVLADVATSLRPLAEVKGLRLEVDTPLEDVVLNTDRRSLSQILINIASNAIKFTEEGLVHVQLGRSVVEGTTVTHFDVIDTGIGIAYADQEKLFKAFEQIEASHTHRYEGTGLGLYISEKLARLLDAVITFHSTPGMGSTFSLRFTETRAT
ncbi:MAG: hypothetical protein QOJ35_1344 [Solirubrobacteraceae bacterium]|nr:hypothetical protein [Solirubrobacteraceae bacterium]